MRNKFIVTVVLSMLFTTSLAYGATNIQSKAKNTATQGLNANRMNTQVLNNQFAQTNPVLAEDETNNLSVLPQEKPRKLSAIEKLFNPKYLSE